LGLAVSTRFYLISVVDESRCKAENWKLNILESERREGSYLMSDGLVLIHG